MKIKFILMLCFLVMVGCASAPIQDKDGAYYQCRLELYCNRSEGSMIKKGAFTAIEIYFSTDLGDGICEKHYQAWGYDYRLPAQQRCGHE